MRIEEVGERTAVGVIECERVEAREHSEAGGHIQVLEGRPPDATPTSRRLGASQRRPSGFSTAAYPCPRRCACMAWDLATAGRSHGSRWISMMRAHDPSWCQGQPL